MSFVEQMNQSAVFLSALLLMASVARKRRQIVHSEPVGRETIQRTDLSADEIVRRTNALFTEKDDEADVEASKAFQELKALHGPAFKRELTRWIGNADDITITEHSFWTDFISRESISGDDGPKREIDAPKYEYRSVTLTEARRKVFLQAAVAMDSTSDGTSKLCGFDPHHRLEFIQQGKEASSMEICFECEEIVWGDANLMRPRGLFPVLHGVVESAGLSTKRDWYKLAREWRERGGSSGGERPAK